MGKVQVIIPAISSISQKIAYVGMPYQSKVKLNSTCTDNLTFALLSGPGWLTINSKDGSFMGFPKPQDVGFSLVELRVTDQFGNNATKTDTILTIHKGDSPGLVTITPNPVNSRTRIIYLLEKPSQITIDILTAEGKITNTFTVEQNRIGIQEYDWDCSSLVNGTYSWLLRSMSAPETVEEWLGELSNSRAPL